jgi:glycosyltransferase involved in cell wall biosynthesis
MHVSISVVILTFDSEETISATLESAKRVSDDIHVVDSFSSDKTVGIVREYGARLVQHTFENYGAQRNWAIDSLPLRYDWELHLDADERLSDELIIQLNSLKEAFPHDISGYYIPRLPRFMGRTIRHGGMFPIWHLRLFRHGRGRCEDRPYDQHFFVDGATANLSGAMVDDMRMTLAEWVSRHNRWSDAQVRELLGDEVGGRGGRIRSNWRGDPVQRKRFLRRLYNGMPLFFRPFLLFLYRYLLRFGFLDGREGLIFFVLQTFWFHFMIDAKLFEGHRAEAKEQEWPN